MIDYKFLYFKTNSAFQRALDANEIYEDSIAFVESPNKFIYTHGVKYPCELSVNSSSDLLERLEEFKEHWTNDLADAIARLSRRMDQLNNDIPTDENLLAWIQAKLNELQPSTILLHLLNGESLLEKDINIPVLSAGEGVKINGNVIGLKAASDVSLGGIKTGFEDSGRNYRVQLDEYNNAFVNVPWQSGIDEYVNDYKVNLTNDQMPVVTGADGTVVSYTNSCKVQVTHNSRVQTVTNGTPAYGSGTFQIEFLRKSRNNSTGLDGITYEIVGDTITVHMSNVTQFAGDIATIALQINFDNGTHEEHDITLFGISINGAESIDLYTNASVIREDYEETVVYPATLEIGVKYNSTILLGANANSAGFTFFWFYDAEEPLALGSNSNIALVPGHESVTVKMYYNDALIDSEVIPYLKDGRPGITGASTVNYYINVLSNNIVLDLDTNTINGNLTFKVLKREGSTVTEMTAGTQSGGSVIWSSSDDEQLDAKIWNQAILPVWQNNSWYISIANAGQYAGQYAYSVITLLSNTRLSLASVVVPFCIKGKTGTASNVQSLQRTVVRMHDSYDDSTTYYAGYTPDEYGVMYMDIVLGSDGCYYRVTRSAGSTVGNPIFDSVTGDLNSTYWSRFSVQDDTYINTLIAEHISATDITAKQIVITSGTGVSTTVVGGLLGDVTTAQDFQQAAEDENVTNTNSQSNPVRIFAGNVQVGGDVSTAPFNVRHDGTLYAASGNAIFNADGTGSLAGGNIYWDANGVLRLNGIKHIKTEISTSSFSIDAIYYVVTGTTTTDGPGYDDPKIGDPIKTNVYYYSIIKDGFLVKRGKFESNNGITTTTRTASLDQTSGIPYLYAGTQNASATYYGASDSVGTTAERIKGWTAYRDIVTKTTIMNLLNSLDIATFNEIFKKDGEYIFENGESVTLQCNNEKYVELFVGGWVDEHMHPVRDITLTTYRTDSNYTPTYRDYLNNDTIEDLMAEITSRMSQYGLFEVLPRLRSKGAYSSSENYKDGRTREAQDSPNYEEVINGRLLPMYYQDYITYTTTTLVSGSNAQHSYTEEQTFDLYCISPNPSDPATAEHAYFFEDDADAFENIGWSKTRENPEMLYYNNSKDTFVSQPLGQFLGDNIVTWSNRTSA